MNKCMEIRHLLKHIGHNIGEAREKVMEAYRMMEHSEQVAMWHRDMAAQHIAFNEPAISIVRRGIDEMRKNSNVSGDDNTKMTQGKCEAYEEWLEHLLPEQAEVRAMIDRFGK